MSNVFIKTSTSASVTTMSNTSVMVYPNVLVNYVSMEASGSQLLNDGTIGLSDGSTPSTASVVANNGLTFTNSSTVYSNSDSAVLLGKKDDVKPETDAGYFVFNSGTIACDGAATDVEGDSGSAIVVGAGHGGNTAYIANEAGGSIDSQYGAGILSQAATSAIDNAGSIDGFVGVEAIGSSVAIRNAGTITGKIGGVFVIGDNATVANSGSIIGTALFGAGFSSGSGKSRFFNSGLLDGDVQTDGAVTFQIVNRGSIDGSVTTDDDTANETIRNAGSISGYVKLGSGTNTFDGRSGSVDGYILGNTGADTIKAGSDGETIAGGAGHDVLYGDAGADTFAFSSFDAADTDRVYQYDTLADIIRLSHSTFTKLAAGKTPEFHVGASASSSTDYLFYNSTTGGLFYDSDGSGAGAAKKIADFDAGLKLTAHDFKVI